MFYFNKFTSIVIQNTVHLCIVLELFTVAENTLLQYYITEKLVAAACHTWHTSGTGHSDGAKFLNYVISLMIKSASSCNLQRYLNWILKAHVLLGHCDYQAQLRQLTSSWKVNLKVFCTNIDI